MSIDMALRWYVVHCDAHQDAQVQREIEQQGVEVFAPRIPRTRTRNGDKPLFLGYVFVHLSLESGVWQRVRYLPGIHCMVEIGGGPCAVDDGIVEGLRRRIAAYSTGVAQLRSGDRVMVRRGVLADLEGIFAEHIRGDERVAILLDLMRRQVRVELPAVEVEPLLTCGRLASRVGERSPGARHTLSKGCSYASRAAVPR